MDISKLGNYFKQQRKRSNMTQLQVAEELHISPQAVSKWERGECLPDIIFLPEIAKMFGVSIEELLGLDNAQSNVSEILKTLNAFVDEQLFAKVLAEFERTDKIQNLSIPLDFFMVLNNQQKETLLEVILNMEDYSIVIDDIFQHLNNAQRSKAIMKIAESGAYDVLESLIPHMTKSIKTTLVEYFLKIGNPFFLEEMLPFLNKEQKNLIIEYLFTEPQHMYLLEDFLPFFDNRQRKEIENLLQ